MIETSGSRFRMAVRLARGGAAISIFALAVALGGCTDPRRCAVTDAACIGGGVACTNTCTFANDGECDDGGPNSEWDGCAFGSDCNDCGERQQLACNDPDFPVFCPQGDDCWATGVDCWTVRYCADGNLYGCIAGYLLDCVRAEAGDPNYCVAAEVCDDSCPLANDGSCDDGSADADTALCLLGTDCTDCGERANPCITGGTSDAFPVYCPQTPSECWSRRVDCDAVQFCPDETDAFACREGQAVDCDAATGCSTTSCTDLSLPVDCGETGCFPLGTDCNTVELCGSDDLGCPFGFELDCADSANPECVPPPAM